MIVLSAIRDISDRKRIMEQLRKAVASRNGDTEMETFKCRRSLVTRTDSWCSMTAPRTIFPRISEISPAPSLAVRRDICFPMASSEV
jgi:hypothetical protein